jgi:Protein of unknown function (DUF3311).
MSKRKMSGQSKLIWVLLLIGLAAMEFPGVFFFQNKVDPFILGFPFIYGYILCWWVYMCAVMLFAYKTRWGQPKGEGGDE